MSINAEMLTFHFVNCIAVGANILLIWLLLKKSKTIQGNFVKLMVAFSVLEIMFSLVNSIIIPSTHSFPNGLIIFSSQSILNNHGSMSLIMLVVFFNLFHGLIIFLSILFMYRYKIIENYASFVKPQSHLKKVAVYFLLTTAIFNGLLLAFHSTAEDDVIAEGALHEHGYNASETSYICLFVWRQETNGDIEHNLLRITGLFLGSIHLTFIMSSIGYSWYKIRQKLNDDIYLHARNFQKQIFDVLTYQVIILIVFVSLPLLLSIASVRFDLDHECIHDVTRLLTSVHPLLNAYVTIYTMEDLRAVVFGNHHFRRVHDGHVTNIATINSGIPMTNFRI